MNKEQDYFSYKIEDISGSDSLQNLSLAISMFTFQFLPERDRLSLMQKIFDNLVDGGAFVTSEKVFSLEPEGAGPHVLAGNKRLGYSAASRIELGRP